MPDDLNLSFRSIVFATDFSSNVGGASRYAALFAQHYDALLIIVHAFTIVQPALEVETLNHVRSQQRQELEQALLDAARLLSPPAPRVRTVLGQDNPVELIRRVSLEDEPSLIVIGAHSAGALQRHIIGSVAEATLRTVTSPVLTVGPEVPIPSRDRLLFRRILFATDFSLAAVQVAPYAFALALAFGSHLDLLHVAEKTDVRTDYERPAYWPGIEQLVPKVLRSQLLTHTFVEFGKVHERIVKHARDAGVDLIVLGAHHHSRLAMHLRTGPTFRTILEAPSPVLTICA
jgi:nucleotide-binding universal stress UspA family protein